MRDGEARGRWRIAVSGAVTPSAAQLLEGLRVTVVGSTTFLETDVMPRDGCARTIAALQSLGLDVVELHRIELDP